MLTNALKYKSYPKLVDIIQFEVMRLLESLMFPTKKVRNNSYLEFSGNTTSSYSIEQDQMHCWYLILIHI